MRDCNDGSLNFVRGNQGEREVDGTGKEDVPSSSRFRRPSLQSASECSEPSAAHHCSFVDWPDKLQTANKIQVISRQGNLNKSYLLLSSCQMENCVPSEESLAFSPKVHIDPCSTRTIPPTKIRNFNQEQLLPQRLPTKTLKGSEGASSGSSCRQRL